MGLLVNLDHWLSNPNSRLSPLTRNLPTTYTISQSSESPRKNRQSQVPYRMGEQCPHNPPHHQESAHPPLHPPWNRANRSSHRYIYGIPLRSSLPRLNNPPRCLDKSLPRIPRYRRCLLYFPWNRPINRHAS